MGLKNPALPGEAIRFFNLTQHLARLLLNWPGVMPDFKGLTAYGQLIKLEFLMKLIRRLMLLISITALIGASAACVESEGTDTPDIEESRDNSNDVGPDSNDGSSEADPDAGTTPDTDVYENGNLECVDCNDTVTCEEGIVHWTKGGGGCFPPDEIPSCSALSSGLDETYTCEKGCRSDGISAAFDHSDLHLDCEESRPKSAGDACEDDTDCIPVNQGNPELTCNTTINECEVE